MQVGRRERDPSSLMRTPGGRAGVSHTPYSPYKHQLDVLQTPPVSLWTRETSFLPKARQLMCGIEINLPKSVCLCIFPFSLLNHKGSSAFLKFRNSVVAKWSQPKIFWLIILREEAGKMAQLLRAHIAHREGLSSSPSTQCGQLTMTCNSSSRRSEALFRTLRAPAFMCTIPSYTCTHLTLRKWISS